MKKILLLVFLIITVIICVVLLNFFNSSNNMEFKTLSEVYEMSDGALSKQYDNLSLPQNITLDKTNKLYTFTADWNIKGDVEKVKDNIVVFCDTITGTKINKSDVQYDESTEDCMWTKNFKTIACSTGLNGGYNIAFVDTEYTVSDATYTYEKLIRFDRGEKEEGAYTLNGKKYSVKDATKFCNQSLKKLEQFIHPSEDLRLKTLFIKKLSDDKYTYKFIAEKLINDIALDEGCNYSNVNTGMSKPTFVIIEIDAPEHINNAIMFFSNSYVMENEGNNLKKQECEDSFLTLASACDNLSHYLAEYNTFELTDIDIKYVCIIGNYASMHPPATEYRPMWTFVLKEKLTHNMSPNDDTRVCAYVDMQSGEIYVVDDITHNVYFELSPSIETVSGE